MQAGDGAGLFKFRSAIRLTNGDVDRSNARVAAKLQWCQNVISTDTAQQRS
jgi:hypothetical protein